MGRGNTENGEKQKYKKEDDASTDEILNGNHGSENRRKKLDGKEYLTPRIPAV